MPESWPGSLVGRRFTTDFVVLHICPSDASRGHLFAASYDTDRVVTIQHQGGIAQLSLGELKTLLDAGFVTESGPTREGNGE